MVVAAASRSVILRASRSMSAYEVTHTWQPSTARCSSCRRCPVSSHATCQDDPVTVAPELELDVLTRARSRAARGGRGRARPGVHPGRRGHWQDPRDHPPDRVTPSAPARSRRAHVLAVTFTARAAGELRGRLRGLGVGSVQARTFHSAALRQLQYFWPRTIGGELPGDPEVEGPAARRGRGRLRLGSVVVRSSRRCG